MGATSIRPFNAINGTELKKIILTRIQNQLNADTRFGHHLTYPQMSWRFKLAINVYPSEPSSMEVEIGPETVKAPGAELLPADTPHVEIDIGGGSDITAPVPGGQTADAARREAGLAVPAPQAIPGPGGERVTVDVPGLVPPKTAPEPTREVTNVEAGGRVFARSVTQRTAAAPEGTEVLPQAGTRPGVEEVQEILRREGAAPPEDEGGAAPADPPA